MSSEFSRGLRAGLPIFIGYLPIGLAFGFLAKATSLGFLSSCAMSAFVYAGASQFMALNLIQSGVGIGQIVLATFMMNLRHLLMSASLSAKMREGQRSVPLIAFGVTDETFSVAAMKPGLLSVPFLIGLELMAYVSWQSGTALGYALGQVLPLLVQKGLGISLYAMFVAIPTPEIRKTWRVGVVAATAAVVHFALGRAGWLASGWNIVIAMLVGATLGTLLLGGRAGDEA